MKKKILKFFFVIILLIIIAQVIFYFFPKKEVIKKSEDKIEIPSYSSNIIQDVKYTSVDAKGNKYTITALTGEIDYSDPSTIFLTKVKALIELTNSNNIQIVSDYGKYNTNNFDTIFSKNVIVNYLDNKITGEYLDFSIGRGNMIISKNVIYTNLDNILKADIIDINIETKDTKISMYDKKNKVNIKSKKYNGNN